MKGNLSKEENGPGLLKRESTGYIGKIGEDLAQQLNVKRKNPRVIQHLYNLYQRSIDYFLSKSSKEGRGQPTSRAGKL